MLFLNAIEKKFWRLEMIKIVILNMVIINKRRTVNKIKNIIK